MQTNPGTAPSTWGTGAFAAIMERATMPRLRKRTLEPAKYDPFGYVEPAMHWLFAIRSWGKRVCFLSVRSSVVSSFMAKPPIACQSDKVCFLPRLIQPPVALLYGTYEPAADPGKRKIGSP
jgi:hypothetical protein